jgi:hypothetical protein
MSALPVPADIEHTQGRLDLGGKIDKQPSHIFRNFFGFLEEVPWESLSQPADLITP